MLTFNTVIQRSGTALGTVKRSVVVLQAQNPAVHGAVRVKRAPGEIQLADVEDIALNGIVKSN